MPVQCCLRDLWKGIVKCLQRHTVHIRYAMVKPRHGQERPESSRKSDCFGLGVPSMRVARAVMPSTGWTAPVAILGRGGRFPWQVV